MLDLPMEIHLRVESITILARQISRVKNRIRLPSIPVPVGPIPLEATLLRLHLGSLQVFIGFPLSWILLSLRVEVGILSCTDPIFRLNRITSTIQAGWGVWIYVLPYLWLEAAFDLSIRASRAMLKPVVARPLRLAPKLGFLNTSLVILA